MLQSVSDFGTKVLILSFVLALLPSSPFVGFSNLIASLPYLSYVNWFIPISEILVILESFLVVISVYYGLLYILNYVGVLKS